MWLKAIFAELAGRPIQSVEIGNQIANLIGVNADGGHVVVPRLLNLRQLLLKAVFFIDPSNVTKGRRLRVWTGTGFIDGVTGRTLRLGQRATARGGAALVGQGRLDSDQGDDGG